MGNRPTPLVSTRRGDMSGTACFHGTRVPVRTLFDYLAEGNPLSEFLLDFPKVSEEHALAVIDEARERAVAQAGVIDDATADPVG